MTAPQQAAAADPGYLMLHFADDAPGQKLYLSHCTDGLHWNDLNGGGTVLRSTVGTRGVRDPALVRSPKGDRYWIIATDLCIGCGQSWGDSVNNGSRNLVVWESADLVTWSAPRLLNVAGAIPDGRTITTPQVYIDRPGGTAIVDTQMTEVPSGVGNHRYVRVSGDGQNTIEGSNSILGTWTNLGNLSSIGLTGHVVEGPVWMKFRDRNEWPSTSTTSARTALANTGRS